MSHQLKKNIFIIALTHLHAPEVKDSAIFSVKITIVIAHDLREQLWMLCKRCHGRNKPAIAKTPLIRVKSRAAVNEEFWTRANSLWSLNATHF
jgi:hypothetical protein